MCEAPPRGGERARLAPVYPQPRGPGPLACVQRSGGRGLGFCGAGGAPPRGSVCVCERLAARVFAARPRNTHELHFGCCGRRRRRCGGCASHQARLPARALPPPCVISLATLLFSRPPSCRCVPLHIYHAAAYASTQKQITAALRGAHGGARSQPPTSRMNLLRVTHNDTNCNASKLGGLWDVRTCGVQLWMRRRAVCSSVRGRKRGP